MSRAVVPELMMLALGSLDEAFQQGRVAKVYAALAAELAARSTKAPEPGVPISLRWGTNASIGIPRAPFDVWRRTRMSKDEPSIAVVGGAMLNAPSTRSFSPELLELRFDAAPQGGSLVVEAMAANGHTLPGQRLEFTSAQSGRFRAAGIVGVKVTGLGSISNLQGLSLYDYANLTDWVRIEVVGLPFDRVQPVTGGYDVAAPQGWDAPSLSPEKAALVRLQVASMLQVDPWPPGGSLATPAWPFPDASRFLDVLVQGPVQDIADCLTASNDTDPAHLQALHTVTRTLPGMHQLGQLTGQPSTVTLSTTQYIGMAVQDGAVATGLGFGTVDIPNHSRPYQPRQDALPVGIELGAHEYMVTAPVELPGGAKLDLAAIGTRMSSPAPFASVAATQSIANRATTRDGQESITVRLGWAPTIEILGAGLLSRRAPAGTTLLNTPRPGSSDGFQPYLTDHALGPDGFPLVTCRPGVTIGDEAVPLSGSATTTYAVAPIDIHGRWGLWQQASTTVAARPVQVPTVHDVSLALPATLPATGPVAPGCTLTVEVSWDWSDRSCDRIEIASAFTSPAPLPDPAPPLTGFATSNTATASGPVVLNFSLAGAPSVAGPASVSEVVNAVPAWQPPPSGSVSNEVRRYRVVIPNVSVSFAAADEVSISIAARGAERVRSSELSNQSNTRQTTAANPFPATVPPLPTVDVLWTAQPDAGGLARTVLSWPASAGAVGYIVWEATETALYAAVSGGASRPEGQSLRTRAADLKTRVMANQAASLRTFSRLNERPITTTSIELVLPGSADTLYVYRISTITSQNVESARSTDIVLVGVPHRDAPTTPRLEAGAGAFPGEVLLTLVPGGGNPPAAVRIHRARREGLADSVGRMGPPVIGPTALSSLTPVTVRSLSGPPTAGFELTDNVTPSWRPYLYRAVVVGQDRPTDGIRAGDSPPSQLVSIVVPPVNPPLIGSPSRTSSPTGHLLTFTSDLPWSTSPVGSGRIVIAEVDTSSTKPVRTVIGSFVTESIAAGSVILGTFPVTSATIARTAPTGGVSTVSILIPPVTGTIVITATDPRGRSTTVEMG